MPACDGDTEIYVCGPDDTIELVQPACTSLLLTPTRQFAISTSEQDVIAHMPLTSTSTRVRVWTNRETEPDQVAIQIG